MAASSEVSDAVLIHQVQAGDEQAFQVLWERYAGRIEGRVQRQLPASLQRRVSVADVMQDARLATFQALPVWEDRGEEGFVAWMARIAELKAKETVRNHARAKRTFRREVTHGQRVDTGNFPGQELSPSEVAMSTERTDKVREAMDMLPDDYREVLGLVFERRLTLGEAGRRMGRSREAMKKLHGRALCRFKQIYQELQGGP